MPNDETSQPDVIFNQTDNQKYDTDLDLHEGKWKNFNKNVKN